MISKMFYRLVLGFALITRATIRGSVIVPLNTSEISMEYMRINKTASDDLLTSLKNSQLPPSQDHNYPTYPQYNFESGYENRLVPVGNTIAPSHKGGFGSSIISSLVPLGSFALTYGARTVIFLFQLLILVVIGIALATSICTFTPICTMTFNGLTLSKNQVREQVSELARAYMTPESLNVATILVKTAVETYAEMQRQQHVQEESEKKKNMSAIRKKSERKRRRK